MSENQFDTLHTAIQVSHIEVFFRHINTQVRFCLKVQIGPDVSHLPMFFSECLILSGVLFINFS